MKPENHIMIIHETVAESWARDASTFALFLALIGVGVLLDSSAMQWVGAIMGFITVIARSIARGKHEWPYLTVSEARKRLDEIETKIAAQQAAQADKP